MQDPETGRQLARRRMSICRTCGPASAFIQISERGSVQDNSAEIREKKWERSVAEDCRKPIEFGAERDGARKENPAPRGSTGLLIRVRWHLFSKHRFTCRNLVAATRLIVDNRSGYG